MRHTQVSWLMRETVPTLGQRWPNRLDFFNEVPVRVSIERKFRSKRTDLRNPRKAPENLTPIKKHLIHYELNQDPVVPSLARLLLFTIFSFFACTKQHAKCMTDEPEKKERLLNSTAAIEQIKEGSCTAAQTDLFLASLLNPSAEKLRTYAERRADDEVD